MIMLCEPATAWLLTISDRREEMPRRGVFFSREEMFDALYEYAQNNWEAREEIPADKQIAIRDFFREERKRYGLAGHYFEVEECPVSNLKGIENLQHQSSDQSDIFSHEDEIDIGVDRCNREAAIV